MNDTCIYKITNTITGEEYVGSTLKGFEWRKRKHLRELQNNKHHNRHLQNSYNKYGRTCFDFKILEIIFDQNDLIKKEQEWVSKLSPIYNVMRDIKSHIGVKRSKETCEKISKALIGKKMSNETKQKLRVVNLGKKQSNDTIQRKRKKNFKPVIQSSRTGEFIKEWSSVTEAAERLNLKRGVIYDCIGGRKPTYKSFRWSQK